MKGMCAWGFQGAGTPANGEGAVRDPESPAAPTFNTYMG